MCPGKAARSFDRSRALMEVVARSRGLLEFDGNEQSLQGRYSL